MPSSASPGADRRFDDAAPRSEPPILTPLWVVVGLSMGPGVALGLARFAYALLLPAMRSDLGWTFADAGAMSTANALGYLIGALLAAHLARRWGDRRAFGVGLLGTALAVAATGLSAHFVTLLLLRLLAGFTGALAFVAGAGLAAAAASGGSPSRAPRLLGLYVSGAGLCVTASALAVPPLLGSLGWRGGWQVLGALALAATAFGTLAARRAPPPAHQTDEGGSSDWSLRFMLPELIGYGLFGAGYIAYATFIIAYLRIAEHFSAAAITVFWAVLGLASVVAAFAWGSVLGHLRGGRGLAATTGVLTLGALLPLIGAGAAGAYLSAVLFGGSFLAVVTAATTFARKAAPPRAWTAAIAALTVAFGLGQCIGPVLSGALSDGPAGVRAGLWLSVIVLMVATLVALMQREPVGRGSL